MEPEFMDLEFQQFIIIIIIIIIIFFINFQFITTRLSKIEF